MCMKMTSLRFSFFKHTGHSSTRAGLMPPTLGAEAVLALLPSVYLGLIRHDFLSDMIDVPCQLAVTRMFS